MLDKLKIHLRILQVDDVKINYVNWYNINDIVRYSDNQYHFFTLEGQKSYVQSCLSNDDLNLYGIFDDKKHIGNIVICGVLSVHKRAELTFVIGEKDYWGKGVASYAVSVMVKRAKNQYNLTKVFAGCAESNIGSRKVLESNGFELEGTRKKHLFYNDEWYDQLDFGLLL